MLSLLPPKTLINILVSKVKKSINRPFEICELVLDNTKDELYFKIDGERFDYDDQEGVLKKLFSELSEAEAKTGDTIEFIILYVKKPDDYILNIYTVSKEGEKLHNPIRL